LTEAVLDFEWHCSWSREAKGIDTYLVKSETGKIRNTKLTQRRTTYSRVRSTAATKTLTQRSTELTKNIVIQMAIYKNTR